jgi:adenylate cyclase
LIGNYRGEQALDCYLKYLQAVNHLERWNIADTDLARKIAEEAVAMYPESPITNFCLAWVYFNDYWLLNTKSPEETLAKSMDWAQRTLAMDDSISLAHSHLCNTYHLKGEHDKAIIEGERAVGLNPSGTPELHAYANALRFAGRPEEAIPLYQKAIRLNPLGQSFLYLSYGSTLRQTGRFEESVSAIKKALQISPDSLLSHAGLAATYSMMGREKEARAEAAEVLRINPKFSVDNYAKTIGYKDQAETDKFVNALRKAGLK